MTDLASIKQLDAELYGRYLRDRAAIVADADVFEKETKVLTKRMEEASAEVTYRDDYEWLRSAAEKWRSVLVSINIPLDVRLKEPKSLLVTAPKPSMIWADSDLDRWIHNRAYELAKERAIRRKERLTAEELLHHMPSTPEEQSGDWNAANILMVCEILDGKMDLMQIRPRSYVRLESCWLEDVKLLKAYFRWLDRGDGLDGVRAKKDYCDVCGEIQARVQCSERKRPESDFGPIRQYIESHYLTDNKVDTAKAHGLIAAKAWRIWAKTGNSECQNWQTAESYVNAFYGSIVQAVCGANAKAARSVADTVSVFTSDEVRHLIVNAFEVAVAISFVAAASTQQTAVERAA